MNFIDQAHVDRNEISVLRERLNFTNYLLTQAETIAQLGHWQWDVETDRVMWSDNLYRIFGIERKGDFIRYEEFIHCIHPDEQRLVDQNIQSYLQNKKFIPYYHRINTPAGEQKTLYALGDVVMDDDGKVIRMYGTTQDVTASKLVEQKLLLKTAELEAKNDELEKFVFIASHDLQEPLRKLILFSSMLRDQCQNMPDEKGLQYISKIIDCSARMRQMIHNFLELATITQTNEFSVVSLDKVVQQVLLDIDDRLEQSGAQIQCSPLPQIRGNELHLYQVFLNLLTNALKFIPAGRKPSIVIKAEPSCLPGLIDNKIFSVNSVHADCYCCVSITDNGIGIDEKEIGDIFKFFKALHKSSEYNGHGIGLAIVKKIMDNHRAHICVRSRPGEGTIFYLVFPVN